MIRYIASDLDGTLLQGKAETLTQEQLDLIAKITQKGIHFFAASGRTYPNLRTLFDPIKDNISYIAENGSLCIHQGNVISKGLIERDLGLRIIKASREIPTCNCMLSCEHMVYTDSKDERFLNHMTNVVRYEHERVDDLCDIPYPFLKIAICDFEGTDQIAPFFQERFKDEIAVVTSGNLWVDFIAPNANKGTALKDLVEHLGLSLEDGIAFGDQYNDIEMLSCAGTSYAMNTCAPGVEKYANKRTDRVETVLKEILKQL